jgi:hypothetical protein
LPTAPHNAAPQFGNAAPQFGNAEQCKLLGEFLRSWARVGRSAR